MCRHFIFKSTQKSIRIYVDLKIGVWEMEQLIGYFTTKHLMQNLVRL